MRKPKKPKEDPSVISFRARQVRDLAELDEDENLRIKRATVPNKRAFRRSSPGRGSVNSSSGRSGEAASNRAGVNVQNQ